MNDKNIEHEMTVLRLLYLSLPYDRVSRHEIEWFQLISIFFKRINLYCKINQNNSGISDDDSKISDDLAE